MASYPESSDGGSQNHDKSTASSFYDCPGRYTHYIKSEIPSALILAPQPERPRETDKVLLPDLCNYGSTSEGSDSSEEDSNNGYIRWRTGGTQPASFSSDSPTECNTSPGTSNAASGTARDSTQEPPYPLDDDSNYFTRRPYFSQSPSSVQTSSHYDNRRSTPPYPEHDTMISNGAATSRFQSSAGGTSFNSGGFSNTPYPEDNTIFDPGDFVATPMGGNGTAGGGTALTEYESRFSIWSRDSRGAHSTNGDISIRDENAGSHTGDYTSQRSSVSSPPLGVFSSKQNQADELFF